MNRVLFAALLVSGGAVALAPAQAQTAAKPVAQPAAKPAAPKAKAKAPAKAAAKPAEPVLPTADVDQVAAATLVLYGDYGCEFNQTVRVAGSVKHTGYVEVDFGKLHYIMRPVLSSTGALRLEDVRGQTLMLQISYKSMLMDVQAGRRMVDECVHEKQAAAKKAAEGLPPGQALLMAPKPAAAAAATPSSPASAPMDTMPPAASASAPISVPASASAPAPAPVPMPAPSAASSASQ
jgi:hypothetical protein